MTVVETLDEAFNRMVADSVPDPRPIYDRLRTEAPVYYSEAFDFWFVSGHALGNAILRDDATWKVNPSWAANSFYDQWPDSYAEGVMARIILRQDDLDHRRLRRLVSTLFTGRAAERMRGRIEALVAAATSTTVSATTSWWPWSCSWWWPATRSRPTP